MFFLAQIAVVEIFELNFSRHRARKRFGQHWLNDPKVLDEILLASDLKQEDRVLEVGPGRGALTSRLIASGVSLVHAIEIDRDLVDGLSKRFANQRSFSLMRGDVLAVCLLPPDGLPLNKVVANIPYNITGPLLKRLIGNLNNPPENIYKSLVLLMQKEVAERIIAVPGDSNFSALSVRVQLMARVKSVCDVSPKSFHPKPNVESKVLFIEPFGKKLLLNPELGQRLETLLKIAFAGRRKKLRNTIGSFVSPLVSMDALARDIGISLDRRPQEIAPLEWLALAKRLWNPT